VPFLDGVHEAGADEGHHPVPEQRGCDLGTAWMLALGAGIIGGSTEVWYFEDARTVLPLLTSLEQEPEIEQLTAAAALLVKESRQIMRPTWHAPHCLW